MRQVESRRSGERARAQVEELYDEVKRMLERQRQLVLGCIADSSAVTVELDAAMNRVHQLQQAMVETVDVLEETKRSFKSKRLGDLRQKLVAELGEKI